MPASERPPLQALIDWADFLEAYARDWDATFDHKAHYFTQEFWYLLVTCTIKYWKGKPLTVSAACSSMKSGSIRTREERIRKAVIDGYLRKSVSLEDGRQMMMLPSEKLEMLIAGHLERTLSQAVALLRGRKSA